MSAASIESDTSATARASAVEHPAALKRSLAWMEKRTFSYRRRVLEIIHRAQAGHTGGSLSCIDILNVLYNHIMRVTPETFAHPERDRYIQSKGHSVEALYVVLADCGFFSDSDLDTLCRGGSPYVGHPTRKVCGIEQNTGALGHGLPLAVGTALGARKSGSDFRVFTLLGDGELMEGSIWEAALLGAHYGLDNLVAIIDHNGLQITGPTSVVCATDPLRPKFEAFGWEVREVDGNHISSLMETLGASPHPGRPTLVLAHTVKGKGIDFMENESKWHHKVPSDEELARALAELDRRARGFQPLSPVEKKAP